jgi:hypothetical protein
MGIDNYSVCTISSFALPPIFRLVWDIVGNILKGFFISDAGNARPSVAL